MPLPGIVPEGADGGITGDSQAIRLTFVSGHSRPEGNHGLCRLLSACRAAWPFQMKVKTSEPFPFPLRIPHPTSSRPPSLEQHCLSLSGSSWRVPWKLVRIKKCHSHKSLASSGVGPADFLWTTRRRVLRPAVTKRSRTVEGPWSMVSVRSSTSDPASSKLSLEDARWTIKRHTLHTSATKRATPGNGYTIAQNALTLQMMRHVAHIKCARPRGNAAAHGNPI